MLTIIEHPTCALHEEGEGHPEQPARYHVIEKALKTFKFPTASNFLVAPLVKRAMLNQTHDPQFVNSIFAQSPKTGLAMVDEDTFMNPHTLTAALYAAGAGVLAVDVVMQAKSQIVFCNIRPPGHHAEYNKAMGFCFFNNVAVAVRYAQTHYHLQRIAIIDFDVHHGNGTQQIFQEDKGVLLCSSFQYPFYPGYDRHKDNEHILNVPLPAGCGGAEFRNKTANVWFNRLQSFQPELIFFSAGFDGHKDDPLSEMNLEKEDYVWLTQAIAAIAKDTCQGKMISMLEGGYNLDALSDCVPAHVNAMF